MKLLWDMLSHKTKPGIVPNNEKRWLLLRSIAEVAI